MEAKTRSEFDGIVEFKSLIKEFLNTGEGSPEVREYISSVAQDDSSLLIYLKGRKYRVKHAWETLKRNAQVRFIEYPEVFPEIVPEQCFQLQTNGVIGSLKARDKFGRRVFYINGGKWDPIEVPLEQLTAVGTHFVDKTLLDEDSMNNGIVLIQDCVGMGMKHFREHSMHNVMRIVNVFYTPFIFKYAYPINVKGVYYLNVPYYLRCIYKIFKPFLPKKLKDRLFIFSSGEKLEALHETVPVPLLPKFLGGLIDNDEAFDLEFFPTPVK